MINYTLVDSNKPSDTISAGAVAPKAFYRHRKLISMGRISKSLISSLCDPVDAANRFINLTLQELTDNSQEKEFLLESKKGIKKASELIKELSYYVNEIEKGLHEARSINRQTKRYNLQSGQPKPEVSL